MYVKTVRKTKDWRFGIEYFNSEIGDVFFIDSAVGFDMLASGVAVRAPAEEIPQDTTAANIGISEHFDVFKIILSQLTNKEAS